MPAKQKISHPLNRRQCAKSVAPGAIAPELLTHRCGEQVCKCGYACLQLEQGCVVHAPDLAVEHRANVTGTALVGDAIQADPVTHEVERDDLLAPVAAKSHALAGAAIEQVQAQERVAGALDRIAGNNRAARQWRMQRNQCQAFAPVWLRWLRWLRWLQ